MKYSLCISNFLDEISSLSQSIVFLYLFAFLPLVFVYFLFLFSMFFHNFFGITRCSRLILTLSFCSFRVNHFSMELWFFLLENGIRNQYLGTGYALGYCFCLSQLREQRNTCICILNPVYTNIYKYFYV